VREDILQGERDLDKFPPAYRSLIEEYFKKLADGAVQD
jgi:hypothetical protein